MKATPSFLYRARSLLSAIKHHGPGWILRRIWHELAAAIPNPRRQKDVLYAFYDLKVSPAHFDFVNFILLAERERSRKACTHLHFVIVPNEGDGFNHNAREKNRQGVENLWWRVRHILLPSCWFVPSCSQVTLCRSRKEARALCNTLAVHVFPKNYSLYPDTKQHLTRYLIDIAQTEKLPELRATPLALYYIDEWIKRVVGNRKLIAIGLRESTYSVARNSILKNWADFAKNLDSALYFPVIIRDLEAGVLPFPGCFEGLTIMQEATWNLELRMALYERAYLMMSVSNGPNILAIFDPRIRYLIFKMLKEECRITPEQLFKTLGLTAGKDWPVATPFQRIIWEDDHPAVIQKAFDRMCDEIERSTSKQSHEILSTA